VAEGQVEEILAFGHGLNEEIFRQIHRRHWAREQRERRSAFGWQANRVKGSHPLERIPS